jgi:hypothetical protein
MALTPLGKFLNEVGWLTGAVAVHTVWFSLEMAQQNK